MWAFAWAWLLYGLCETLFAIALPAARARLECDDFSHLAGPTAALLALYPVAGAALGALCQRGLRLGAREPILALLASASVVVALLANLIARADLGKSGVVLLAGFAALFALALRDARRGEAQRTVWVLAAPWVLVPLAVMLGWLLRDLLLEAPLARRLGACAALAAVWLTGAWGARAQIARAWRTARGTLRAGLAGALALGVAVGSLLWEPPPALPAPPRSAGGAPVVLVVLDTVRADHLSVYGYARQTAPTLEAFARESLLFENLMTPADMTLPSHASLFSGQYVARHGVTLAKPALAEPVTTLAEHLARAGYASYGISANCGWLGEGHGFEQGFAHWDTRCGRSPFAGVTPVFLRQRVLGALRLAFFRERASWRWRSAAEISDEALRVLAPLAEAGAPFLLFLNYMDVHRPIHPPSEYRTKFPGFDPAFDMADTWSALYAEVNEGKRAVTTAERAHLESQYDGALLYADTQLARVFDELRASGLWEKSLVIVTSDHGESFGDHATFGHGHGVYQDVVHAPLLVKAPGRTEPRRIVEPVSLVDVLPTVLDALALPPANDVDGLSLLRPLPSDRPLLAESVDRGGELARALRRGSRKLVRHRGRGSSLYDVASDPGERRDLTTERAAEAADAERELTAFLKLHEGGAASAKLTPEEAERLKALGYLQ